MRLKGHRCSCLHFAAFVTVMFVARLPGARAAGLNPDLRYIEGELLVKFKGGPQSPAALTAKKIVGHEVKRDFEFIGWQHIRLPAGMKVEEGLARYKNLTNVLAVEPNYIRTLLSADSTCSVNGGESQGAPNDPRFNGQWALTKISASNAWNVTTGSTN